MRASDVYFGWIFQKIPASIRGTKNVLNFVPCCVCIRRGGHRIIASNAAFPGVKIAPALKYK